MTKRKNDIQSGLGQKSQGYAGCVMETRKRVPRHEFLTVTSVNIQNCVNTNNDLPLEMSFSSWPWSFMKGINDNIIIDFFWKLSFEVVS